MSLGHKLRYAPALLRAFGPQLLAHRLAHRLSLRIGYYRRRLPQVRWEHTPLESFLGEPFAAAGQQYRSLKLDQKVAFFFRGTDPHPLSKVLQNLDSQRDSRVLKEAEAILHGKFTYFSHHRFHLGLPPDWHSNPFTGQRTPRNRHWSEIGDFEHGDIKAIWELNRFGFVYTLARAYWRTRDERYCEGFWQLLEDWREQNPPQSGANWKCGQETALRVMAWCFAMHAFMGSAASSPGRMAQLGQMIAVSGDRIEALIDHALAQNNNHGISEATGLWTLALLFPEFASSRRRLLQARTLLEREGLKLIYPDGSFCQHSFNYQRLVLQLYLWAIRLGELNGQPLADSLQTRVKAAAQLLLQVQDSNTGRVPNYGHNDGALILPLNDCDYADYRPVLQAASWWHTQCRLYPPGPWDEDTFWLFGEEALQGPRQSPERVSLRARDGGYLTLRSSHSFVFSRCGSFRHRPAQADLLHLDLWWRGHNLVCDPGTFSYNAPPPWDAFPSTRVHSTATVRGQDQMLRWSRFLWLPWISGRTTRDIASDQRSLKYWEGEIEGFPTCRPPVRHRRGILSLPEDGWVVVDRLESAERRNLELHWLLADFPFEWESGTGRVRLDTPSGSFYVMIVPLDLTDRPVDCSLLRGPDNSARGWLSRYYLDKQPAISLLLSVNANLLYTMTIFSPEPIHLENQEGIVNIARESNKTSIQLNGQRDAVLVSRVESKGAMVEVLPVEEAQ